MMVESKLSPLELLSQKMATSLHVAEDARNEIVDLLQVLGSIPESFEYEFEQALRRYLIENGGIENGGVNRVLSDKFSLRRRELIGLAQDISGENDYCSEKATKKEAVNKIMEAISVKPIKSHPIFKGIQWINRRLEDSENLGTTGTKQKVVEIAQLGWNYLETILKVCICFYNRAFNPKDKSSISNAFANAMKKIEDKSPTGLFENIKGIENSYSKDESEQYRARCQWYLDRPSPFHSLLEGEEEYQYKGRRKLIEAFPEYWRNR